MSQPTIAPPVIAAEGIEKSFLGVKVLHDIKIDLRPGEVHALVGENGAGKSTLMKILAGVHQPDTGAISVAGVEQTFAHPLQAQQAGIAPVFQEFNLLPERSVAENVYCGREPRRRGLVDPHKMAADTARLLSELGVDDISPDTRVGSLSVARQQGVEIVKALSLDAKIVPMDEPTAALADHEVELLYRLVRHLTSRGVAVLYVSHRLKEIFDLADRVTVLKDGHHVDTVDRADLTPDALVKLMVGRSFTALFPDRVEGTEIGDVRISLHGCGNEQLDGIDLEVRAGEIVGLAGLQGSGRTELGHGIFGVERFTRGTMKLNGETIRVRSARQAARAGLGLIPEARKAQGLALNRAGLDNARLVLDAIMPHTPARAAKKIPGILSSLQLVARGMDQEVRFLSGGNQQKIVLAKWLAAEPTAVVLDEPTRGIDVGAKQAVYDLMRNLAAQGIAQLLITSELPELIGMRSEEHTSE